MKNLNIMQPSKFCQLASIFCFSIFLTLTVTGKKSFASDPPTHATYERLEAIHGHVCAGSLFGARLGQAAKDALIAAGGKGKLTARYFDLSCPVDGIQVAAGTTYGNGALKVDDRNEHRLILTAEGNKQQVEATLTSKASQLALRSKELSKKARNLPDNSEERTKLESEIEEITSWLSSAPTDDVVVITAVGKR